MTVSAVYGSRRIPLWIRQSSPATYVFRVRSRARIRSRVSHPATLAHPSPNWSRLYPVFGARPLTGRASSAPDAVPFCADGWRRVDAAAGDLPVDERVVVAAAGDLPVDERVVVAAAGDLPVDERVVVAAAGDLPVDEQWSWSPLPATSRWMSVVVVAAAGDLPVDERVVAAAADDLKVDEQQPPLPATSRWMSGLQPPLGRPLARVARGGPSSPRPLSESTPSPRTRR